jgi:hypothetical protein
MTTLIRRSGAATVLLSLLLSVPAALAQAAAPATGTRNFEVISTDGNHLVVRDENGIQEYTVPEDFRFTVDGKQLAATDLKPGMRGTATLTSATSTRAVHVTMVKMGTVVSQNARSVTVKTDDGKINRFTQSEADARGLQIYMDGKPVKVSALNPGDRLDATIVTTGTPEILTAQALDESLAAAGEAARAGEPATPAPEPAPSAAREEPRAAAATPVAPAEKKEPDRMWLWVVLILIGALFVYLAVRRPVPRQVQVKRAPKR